MITQCSSRPAGRAKKKEETVKLRNKKSRMLEKIKKEKKVKKLSEPTLKEV